MNQLALTAIGADRPGIVAGVTRVLFELGCNLADCSMTRLGGQFAMIMLIEAPGGVTPEELETGLAGPAGEFGLTMALKQAPPTGPAVPRDPHVISVYGADKPGIVYRVTESLAASGVNVTDLVSHVVGTGIYTVVLDVELPEGLDPPAFGEELAGLARKLGVELAMRPSRPDEL